MTATGRVLSETSFLFVTLDSCRFDSFAAAHAPHLKSVGPLYRAMAPSYLTYASHAAMFVGFTPGDASVREPFVNPKFVKIFRMRGGGSTDRTPPFATLGGRTVVEGFKQLGYLTVGTGAVNWFDPATPTGRLLGRDFDRFFYSGDTFSLRKQLRWLDGQLGQSPTDRVFMFLNVGETHLPYYHEGAPWSRDERPSRGHEAADARRRQVACVEWVDRQLEDLLRRFEHANVLVCADHGDAWGEDGLWWHGFHHLKVLEVPLLFRLDHPPPMARPLTRPLWRRASARIRRHLIRAADRLPS